MQYNTYLSGLYGGSSTSSTTTSAASTSSTTTTASSAAREDGSSYPQAPQTGQDLSPKHDNNNFDQRNDYDQQSNNQIKNSSYSADSLSRSYFDVKGGSGNNGAYSNGFDAGKSGYDATATRASSSESPTSTSTDMKMQMKTEAPTAAATSIDFTNHAAAAQQQAALQAYYSQMTNMQNPQMAAAGQGQVAPSMGDGAASNAPTAASTSSTTTSSPLPPLLPMAAQLSQYAAANYGQSNAAAAAAAAAASGEYRRPLSVLF